MVIDNILPNWKLQKFSCALINKFEINSHMLV